MIVVNLNHHRVSKKVSKETDTDCGPGNPPISPKKLADLVDWLGPQKTKLIWKNTKSKVYGGRKKKQFQVAHLWEHEFLRLIFFNIVEGRVSFKRWWENCFDFSLPEMLFHKGYIIFWFAKKESELSKIFCHNFPKLPNFFDIYGVWRDPNFARFSSSQKCRYYLWV